ncbi:hypothetical protein [Tautonia sociabilis]|uniref:Uncharacterized protein n=1 Tax=Tautonia sociabilis TaxID=2080755 RepID=A0A432MIX4_9BACT|nr:hypothetical protein [Tautonia sociabilis]RUL87106.1 hypothetical protein TsocGM_14330 [Tautonia sociabilis]
MERYALRILQPGIPAPPGLRALVIREDPDRDDPSALSHQTLAVLAIQPQVVHHYSSDVPRPVHPDPLLMERLGWHYRHQESRLSPICLTADGRLAPLDPDDPSWLLLEPGTPDDRVELLARRLKDEELLRRTLEHSIEDRDQGNVESD